MTLPGQNVSDICSRCAARLKVLRNRPGLPLRADAFEILSILGHLAAVPVTVRFLKETGIGLEVNNKFLRDHANKDIRAQSCELIRKWKEVVGISQPAEHFSISMESSDVDCISEMGSAELPRTPVATALAFPPASPGSPVKTAEDCSPSAADSSPKRSSTISAAEFLARCKPTTEQASSAPELKQRTRSHADEILKDVMKQVDRKTKRLAVKAKKVSLSFQEARSHAEEMFNMFRKKVDRKKNVDRTRRSARVPKKTKGK
eukprot:TRINITY_DN57190_c0_g1_i1.p1 TRINITY_DN57190_c0_g1~~TRINITY_DN57190_c0_g1_i1.p1  ORF type:complete len:261 (-),score=36.65 TRINITY_DN57190_c0_g1_i1:335-1117(-)